MPKQLLGLYALPPAERQGIVNKHDADRFEMRSPRAG
jgi:hypothetical protein